MRFRNKPLYRGEYFVALTIPKSEDPNVVPCDAKPNPDGSYRFVFNLLYAFGDICFARQHGERVVAEHPTWKAGLYRTDRQLRDSILVAEIA